MALDSEPVGKDDTTPNRENEPYKKGADTNPEMPLTPAPVEPDYQEAPHHCHVRCQQEKTRWDRVKPFVEAAGIILLFVYTTYTVKMYNVTRKALIATSAAVFVCQAQMPGNVNGFVVECRNHGSAPATKVDADVTFIRDESGNQVQSVQRSLTRAAVASNEEFAFLIPVGTPNPTWDWVSKQAMTANLNFSYNNGIETIRDNECWALVVERLQRAWTVTDCGNAAAINNENK